jgi:hypothetical protein
MFIPFIDLYLRAGYIENLCQASKAHQGLDEYRMGNAEAIAKHWRLVFVAYSLSGKGVASKPKLSSRR